MATPQAERLLFRTLGCVAVFGRESSIGSHFGCALCARITILPATANGKCPPKRAPASAGVRMDAAKPNDPRSCHEPRHDTLLGMAH